ncbi:MAG: hypothetical protein KDD04_10915, partial [Sinomicrobium sp.]|nr:hypothetical protein [Sinomicrobium sp.]
MNAFKGCLILFAVWSIHGFSQVSGAGIPDPVTAQNHTYETLRATFIGHKNDSAMAALYANAYVMKGKKEHNAVRIAEGYEMLWGLNRKNRTGLAYSDSIIDLTKDINDNVFPARGYLIKGF